MMQRIRSIATLVFFLSLLGGTALAVEEPPYQTVLKDDQFEIRDYPALVVAEVSVTGDQKDAGNKGFRLLASYIFGANQRKTTLSTTAPTVQQAPSEKIPMTAPVLQTEADGLWVVRFTMPSGYSLENLPQPNDDRVKLHVVPPGRFAVITFSGLAYPRDVEEKTSELSHWIEQHSLHVAGRPSLAQYNPPWTLWFLRRNEILIEVSR